MKDDPPGINRHEREEERAVREAEGEEPFDEDEVE